MIEGLKCPKCGSKRSIVIGKKDRLDGIQRRRECADCGERWSTYEFGNDMVKRIKDRAWYIGMEQGREEGNVTPTCD